MMRYLLMMLMVGWVSTVHAGWEEDLADAKVQAHIISSLRESVQREGHSHENAFNGFKNMVKHWLSHMNAFEKDAVDTDTHVTQTGDVDHGLELVHDLTKQKDAAERGWKALGRLWFGKMSRDVMGDMTFDVAWHTALIPLQMFYMRTAFEMFWDGRKDVTAKMAEMDGSSIVMAAQLKTWNPEKKTKKQFRMNWADLREGMPVFSVPAISKKMTGDVSWAELRSLEERLNQQMNRALLGKGPMVQGREMTAQEIKDAVDQLVDKELDAFAPGTYGVWQNSDPYEADQYLKTKAMDRVALWLAESDPAKKAIHMGRLLRIWRSHELGRKLTAAEKAATVSVNVMMFPRAAQDALELMTTMQQIVSSSANRDVGFLVERKKVFPVVTMRFRDLWNGTRPVDIAPKVVVSDADLAGYYAAANQSDYATTKATQAANQFTQAQDLEGSAKRAAENAATDLALYWWRMRPAERTYADREDDGRNRRLHFQSELRLKAWMKTVCDRKHLSTMMLWDAHYGEGSDDLFEAALRGTPGEGRALFLRGVEHGDLLEAPAQRFSQIVQLIHDKDGEHTDMALATIDGARAMARDLWYRTRELPEYAGAELDEDTSHELETLCTTIAESSDVDQRREAATTYSQRVWGEVLNHVHAVWSAVVPYLDATGIEGTKRGSEAVAMAWYAFSEGAQRDADAKDLYAGIRANLEKAAALFKERGWDGYGLRLPVESLDDLAKRHTGWQNFRHVVVQMMGAMSMWPGDLEGFKDAFRYGQETHDFLEVFRKEAIKSWGTAEFKPLPLN